MGFKGFFKPTRRKLLMFALIVYYEIVMQTVRYCLKPINTDSYICNFIVTSTAFKHILGLLALPIHSIPIILFYPFSQFYFWILTAVYWWWLVCFINNIHEQLVKYKKYPKDFLLFLDSLRKLKFKTSFKILSEWMKNIL